MDLRREFTPDTLLYQNNCEIYLKLYSCIHRQMLFLSTEKETIIENHNRIQCRDQQKLEHSDPIDSSIAQFLYIWLIKKTERARIPGNL